MSGPNRPGARGVGLLRDPEALLAADTVGLLPAAGSAGAQVRSVAALPRPRPEMDRPRAMVVVGPTAAVDAAVLTALVGPRATAPIVAATELPGWVGPLDLVVILAARRDDDHAALAAATALRRGAFTHVRSAADGPVAAAAGPALRPVEVAVPEALAAPGRIALLAWAAAGAGLLPAPDLARVADLLDTVALAVHPRAESFTNPAINLADYLAGAVPVFLGADPVADAIAAHAADAFVELAGAASTALPTARALLAPMLLRRIGADNDVFADPFADDEDRPMLARPVLISAGPDRAEPAAAQVMAALRRLVPRAPLIEPSVTEQAVRMDPRFPSEVPQLPGATPLGRALNTLIQLDMAAVCLGVVLGALRPTDHPEGLGRAGGALWAVRSAAADPGRGADRSDADDSSGGLEPWN